MEIKKTKFLQYDGTIHAGHLLTAATIIVCTVSAWANMQATLATVKEENSRQDNRMDKIELANERRDLIWRDDIKSINANIKDGFRELSQKLDNKVDKK